MAENGCAHPDCKCTVPEGEEYCSDHCRQHGHQASGECQCGHPACE